MSRKKTAFLRLTIPAPGDGQAASLELLYRHHHRWLQAQARRRFGADQAEDIVQEAYLRAAAYQGREVRNPRALLMQIATNVAIDLQRRLMSRPAVLEVEELEPVTPDSQVEALALKQVISALPVHLRDVFVLSRFAGLTYDEIADRLGISAKTVEWRMSKALKKLAHHLDLGSRR